MHEVEFLEICRWRLGHIEPKSTREEAGDAKRLGMSVAPWGLDDAWEAWEAWLLASLDHMLDQIR